jgi:hypothetical protein
MAIILGRDNSRMLIVKSEQLLKKLSGLSGLVTVRLGEWQISRMLLVCAVKPVALRSETLGHARSGTTGTSEKLSRI